MAIAIAIAIAKKSAICYSVRKLPFAKKWQLAIFSWNNKLPKNGKWQFFLILKIY